MYLAILPLRRPRKRECAVGKLLEYSFHSISTGKRRKVCSKVSRCRLRETLKAEITYLYTENSIMIIGEKGNFDSTFAYLDLTMRSG